MVRLLTQLVVFTTLICLTEALSARWTQADVPKGGFSKRGREEAARREGRTYSDPYENPGTGYDNYQVSPTTSYVMMIVAVVIYLFLSGWFVEIEVRIRSFLENRRRRPAPSRPTSSNVADTVADDSLRRARIARFAAD
eukprot:TRINITY_DN38772_c0_g1_i1.p1 TRINITY_DN38772_c0_g1~~TRINITY_DN38772_c0_g1_i1.p1  ORF type:complete len:139 (+),score=19.46 TRINITY_DN38772_c0_g1_i1:52-468(+)